MKKFKTACSLNCWDICAIEVTVDEDKVVKIQGDPNHPITRGFLCQKGIKHMERVLSPNRLTSPMKKLNNRWVSITWEEAIKEISHNLREIKENYGSTALIHYKDFGHGGLLKNIDTAFFNSYGGVTSPKGSLCWGAGMAAQELDFGRALSHDPEDHLNSKTIIIWGRNPAYTNPHLVPFLKKAKEKGTNIVVIDPIKTATAKIATHHYPVLPESDGFLALAMAKLIIEEEIYDPDFVHNYSRGFDHYVNYIKSLNLEELIDKTGLSLEDLSTLVDLYAKNKPSAIILGYGLQRYYNGGKNIRFIDALGALTGNIGIPGGGVSYANKYTTNWINHSYINNTLPYDLPSFKRSLFSQYVLEERPNEIKGIFVTTSNPVSQLPNTTKTIEAFRSIPFKVVIDHFLTDTAQMADYVLPCTHIYEEEDFIFSSMWLSYFYYTEKILPPRNHVKNEFEIFTLLAKEMNMVDFLEKYPDERTYLEKSLYPLLADIGLSLDDIKGKSLKLEGNTVPWKNRIFATPSKKFQFINPAEDGLEFISFKDKNYPLHLLTLHPKHSLHSQHFIDEDPSTLPKVYGNSKTFKEHKVSDGEEIRLLSKDGSIRVVASIDEGVRDDVLMVYEGWWLKNQGVNHLTPDGVSDIGDQGIMNNCICKIRKC